MENKTAYCWLMKSINHTCCNSTGYLHLIRVTIGHKTSLRTGQVTATSPGRVTGRLTNYVWYYNLVSEYESRGGINREFFFNVEEILRKCVGSRSV